MTDKEFGDIIKKKLEEYRSEYDPASWDALEERLNAPDDASEADFDRSVRAALSGFAMPEDVTSDWEALEARMDTEEGVSEDAFDQSVRTALAGFMVPEADASWDAMEKKLEASEQESFDDSIRSSMEKFKEPYDSSSWPVLDNKIDEDDRLRRRLIVAKVLEVAAVLLFVLTLHNLMPDIKELISPDDVANRGLAQNQADEPVSGQSETLHATNDISDNLESISEQGADIVNVEREGVARMDFESNATAGSESIVIANVTSRNAQNVVPLSAMEVNGFELVTLKDSESCEVTPDLNRNDYVSIPPTVGATEMNKVGLATAELTPPSPRPFKSRKSLKLSLAASLDVNSLYMPDEQFYVGGQKIRFSERTLAALGFSTGAGFIFNYGAWSFETGLYYSSKQFEPNRVLQIGKAFDVRTLDFERISLHVVSVPLYAHWNFDRKGKTRFYAVGGAGFNLIASANYDLLTRRVNSRSAPPGAGSSKTDLEVQQIKENILDGAEFSSKSFVNVTAGFGVEHYLSQRLSIFTQPTYSYQIPFFHFSDQNGKHLENIAVQFGTRMRLR